MHSDYVMRMIERFMQALIGIVRARKAEDYEEAYNQIQNAGQLYCNIHMLELLQLTPEGVLKHFRNGEGVLDAEQSIFCADLLAELAFIFEAKQRDDLALRSKILCLYLYLNAIPLDERFQTDVKRAKIASLMSELKSETLPESVVDAIESNQKWIGRVHE